MFRLGIVTARKRLVWTHFYKKKLLRLPVRKTETPEKREMIDEKLDESVSILQSETGTLTPSEKKKFAIHRVTSTLTETAFSRLLTRVLNEAP